MSDEQTQVDDGSIVVQKYFDDVGWDMVGTFHRTRTDALNRIKANREVFPPGTRFRIIKVLQEGTVVSKSDVLVAD